MTTASASATEAICRALENNCRITFSGGDEGAPVAVTVRYKDRELTVMVAQIEMDAARFDLMAATIDQAVERIYRESPSPAPLPEVGDPEVGDYVLATKYDDGDPMDHFFVGFVSEVSVMHDTRYMVVDNEGRNQRANGFRRAEKITEEEGRKLVEMFPCIADTPGPSLWWHLAQIRNGF